MFFFVVILDVELNEKFFSVKYYRESGYLQLN